MLSPGVFCQGLPLIFTIVIKYFYENQTSDKLRAINND